MLPIGIRLTHAHPGLAEVEGIVDAVAVVELAFLVLGLAVGGVEDVGEWTAMVFVEPSW